MPSTACIFVDYVAKAFITLLVASAVEAPSGELKVGAVERAVLELHHQLPTGPFPSLLRLPVVVVLVRARLVGEAASSRGAGRVSARNLDVWVVARYLL